LVVRLPPAEAQQSLRTLGLDYAGKVEAKRRSTAGPCIGCG